MRAALTVDAKVATRIVATSTPPRPANANGGGGGAYTFGSNGPAAGILTYDNSNQRKLALMLCGWTRMDDEVRTIKCTVVTAVHGESVAQLEWRVVGKRSTTMYDRRSIDDARWSACQNMEYAIPKEPTAGRATFYISCLGLAA